MSPLVLIERVLFEKNRDRIVDSEGWWFYTARPNAAWLRGGEDCGVGFGLFRCPLAVSFGLMVHALWKSGGSKRGI